MLQQEYLDWFRASVEEVPYATAPPLLDDTPVDVNWPLDTYRCDPFDCHDVCCRSWCIGEGIPLLVGDLVRLADGGLLNGVHGGFATSAEVNAFIADPENVPSPRFPRLGVAEASHCIHYDPKTHACGIYDHRPSLCRTFPYAAGYDAASQGILARFTGRCSRVPNLKAPATLKLIRIDNVAQPAELAQPASDEAPIPPEFQPRRVPLGELPAYDRRHIEACVARGDEQLRSLYLVARRPDLVEELGLGGFLQPNSSNSEPISD